MRMLRMRLSLWRSHVRASMLALVVLGALTWLLLYSYAGNEALLKLHLEQGGVELRERLQYAEMLLQNRQKQILGLQQRLSLMVDGGKSSVGDNNTITMGNITLSVMQGSDQLVLPSIYSHLPHLLQHNESLLPSFSLSRGRTGVSLVIGIPTIQRQVKNYLLETLQSLLDAMTADDKQTTLIIVFIAESSRDYIEAQAKEITSRFQLFVDNGLIDIIAPSPDYYPDFATLKPTLGDQSERFRWRTKQNLDFAYLMMYSQSRGTYYLQVEDDIVAKPQFTSTIRNFIVSQTSSEWFMLEFSQLGFIGKLFKTKDLGQLSEFLLMFHMDKPVDWLLDHLLYVRLCLPDKDMGHCVRMKAKQRIRYKPSLFQHVGTHSSLKGKVQKLKDKDFGKVPLFRPHTNPSAKVSTSLKVYKQHTLEKAYAGQDYFWAHLPRDGDYVRFDFTPSIVVDKYIFRTGNTEHAGDIFLDTSVEVLPFNKIESLKPNQEKNSITKDGFVRVGSFVRGLANGTVPVTLGSISALRLVVHKQSLNWVVLSEISIQASTKS
ncbi:PREDICTED: alpha-1,3-mannosyl-glycoprotein 4-beta-N-acetylglucosaminyltransferase A-like isoform X1 [Priapulus caudatus]|uniref:Alpha-1,3-mannosyl-glycoprotein 4-beta-N-acetylglucosaminyltransferase A-like isoform X1 n=1 Tax=Priapulus caudatus TaxID=37621 RepID=A0ABM1FBF2_PRICU|nr:PREDICTED: alpha-1,3-mannosyl-glycoprotein 4-beta-N-acetylglucosaminyltransferase A-like isoform X1 [Priapulus caudatus]